MPKTTIDPTKAAATYLGVVQGASGAMQLVACDGGRASAWPGWEGSDDGRNRNLLADWKDEEAGTTCDAGSAGQVSVWRTDDGLALLEFFPDDDFDSDSKEGLRQLALRVAQVPAKGRPKSQGFVRVESGSIAMMLEYAEANGVTKKLLDKAARAKGVVAFHDHGVLVPLENGRYEILLENLGPGSDGYDDEIGLCATRTRIVRAANQTSKKSKPGKLAKPSIPEIEYAGPRAEPWGSTQVREPFDFVALDAADAARYDGADDFDRAFDIVARKKDGWGPMTTKAGAPCLVGKLGLGLAITFWKLEKGAGLLDLDLDPKELDIKSKTGKELLGAHFAQLVAAKSDRIGTVTVRSGALCVMRTMAHPKTAPRPNGDKPKIMTEIGAVFPLPNGTYEVHRDVLGDERRGLATEIGRLHVRVRFLRGGKSSAAKSQPAEAKPAKKKSAAAKPAKKKSAAAKPVKTKPAKNKSANGRVHLEMSEGSSNKFWETWIEGSTLFVRFGRIGTDGQTKPKTFATADAAAKERDSLIASKRKKGYA